MATPFEVYYKYVAIKLHFSSDKYDYFENNGRVKASQAAFEKRRDRYFFQKLSKKYSIQDLDGYFAANFVDNPNIWVGDLTSERCDDIYLEWKRKIQSMKYTFKGDVRFLDNNYSDFNKIFECENGGHPFLLWCVLHGDISLESFVIMNKVLNFFPQFDRDIQSQDVWKNFQRKCLKYEPFLNIMDLKVYANIMKEELCYQTSRPFI